MAIMIPNKPIKNNSNAEEKLFRRLKNILSDEWIVVHSYKLNEDIGDNEVDFLIIHKDIGVLVIEVKGGGVGCEERVWYTVDRNGRRISLKMSPYTQANNNKVKIYHELKELMGDKIINVSKAVVFPDINKERVESTNTKMKKLTLFKDDVYGNDLEGSLVKIVKSQYKPNELSDDEITKIKEYFNYIFKGLYTERDGYLETKEHFIRLTDEQNNIAKGLLDNKQVSINGPAGTGKTIIALYKISHGLENNENILYICHNSDLSKFIDNLTKNNENKEHVNVCTLSHFKKYYKVEENIEKWDSIIIDEAQEFLKADIDMIKSLKSKNLYCLYDSSQILTKSRVSANLDYLELDCKFSLHKNIRNTDQITDLCYRLINKNPEQYKNGIDGKDPIIVFIKDNKEIESQLEKYILDKTNAYNLNEILVLTTEIIRNSEINCQSFNQNPNICKYIDIDFDKYENIVKHDIKDCNKCIGKYTRTIRQSKGIEKPYIVLVDEGNYVQSNILKSNNYESKLIKNMLYTGISRAMYKVLIVLNYKNDYECKAISNTLNQKYLIYDNLENYFKENQ